MISKIDQIRFYEEELKELELEVKKDFHSTAKALFNSGNLYVGQYRGYDTKRGNVFIDIPEGDGYHAPRIDQLMNCFELLEGNCMPKQWGQQTYADLIEKVNANMSEVKLVNYTTSQREGWITMILSQMEFSFLESLEHNDLLGLGPTIPPFEYLQNLLEFSKQIGHSDSLSDKILNYKFEKENDKKPNLLLEDIDIAEQIISEVDNSDFYIFQGPPGTGKTHQIADVISRLAGQGFSVLVTALTNKAAVEVCEKPFLNDLLKNGMVWKTGLQSSEKRNHPELKLIKDIIPLKGNIILSTYYQFSKVWVNFDQDFDYVIVEEASQSFLTTIAAAAKVGKKVIVVGDPYQILPIVKYNHYRNISPEIDTLVNGLQTICHFADIPLNRKTETRRLSPRATEYTNLFYQNTIISKSIYESLANEKERFNLLKDIIHDRGGPTLLLFEKTTNNILDSFIPFLTKAINEIKSHTDNTVAVLTPFIKLSLIPLQKKLKAKTDSNDYLIDTVDRVQGLDVDYCFYVIPDTHYRFSYNLNRFNVATSRSKKATFILLEKAFYKKSLLRGNTGIYLKELLAEFCFEVKHGEIVDSKIVLNTTLSISEAADGIYDKVYNLLIKKELISEGKFYNSLLDAKGNVIAEAEFVFRYGDVNYAVEPFTPIDEQTFMKNNYKIIQLNDVLKLIV